MGNDRSGLVSLTLSFSGLLLFLLDFLAVWLSMSWISHRTIQCSFFTSVALEVAAVGFGFATRDTMMGKAGLALSLLTLGLILFTCCSMVGVLGWGGSGVNG